MVKSQRWSLRDILSHINSVTKNNHKSDFLYRKLHSRNCHIWSISFSCMKLHSRKCNLWSNISPCHFTCEVSYMKFTYLFDQLSCGKLPIWNLLLSVIKLYRYICMKMSRTVHHKYLPIFFLVWQNTCPSFIWYDKIPVLPSFGMTSTQTINLFVWCRFTLLHLYIFCRVLSCSSLLYEEIYHFLNNSDNLCLTFGIEWHSSLNMSRIFTWPWSL